MVKRVREFPLLLLPFFGLIFSNARTTIAPHHHNYHVHFHT